MFFRLGNQLGDMVSERLESTTGEINATFLPVYVVLLLPLSCLFSALVCFQFPSFRRLALYFLFPFRWSLPFLPNGLVTLPMQVYSIPLLALYQQP